MFETLLTVNEDGSKELRAAHYPNLTLYIELSELPTGKFSRRPRVNEEIKYVETGDAAFFVKAQGLPHPLTMSLVWGALGKTVGETARQLYASEATIKLQRQNLYRKLGASTMAHAIRVAFDEHVFAADSTKRHADLDATPRDLEVLNALSLGDIKEGVGKRLHITANTVKRHANNVLTKNHLDNCTQAVMMAHLSGQLPLLPEIA